MSHNKSPGPSTNSHPQMFAQSASATSTRQKNKSYATGIAAGVEDEKYQTKYKELRRKVKEIELDNDKLHFKVLQAKKSISRMKLERAVLYERLSAVPPSPDVHDQHALPPVHPGPGIPPQHTHHAGHHHHRDREHSHPMDMNDHNAMEYIHPHSNIRVISGPDGRAVQVSEGPIGPGVAPSSHAVSSVRMSRRGSGSGHDSSRQLPPLSQMTPSQHLEPPRAHGHSHPHSPHLHPHSNGSHSRSRSHSSSSRSRGHQVPGQGASHGYHQYSPETFPPAQHGLHSPPAPTERERSRRHEHERSSHHGDPHAHGRHQMLSHSHSSSHSSMLSPVGTRGGSRVHNHQRVGPGANVNHADIEYEREMDRERAWAARERERELDHEHESAREYSNSAPMHASPPSHSRSRQLHDRGDYGDHHVSYRLREEPIYTREPIGPGVHGGGRSSRSGTPRSGSGSGSGNGATGEVLPRPDAHSQYYDRERPRPYAPRTANQPQTPNEEHDFVHEDGRVYTRDRTGGHLLPSEQQHRPSLDSSRKRSRNDMEVDGDDDVDASPTGGSSGDRGESFSRFSGGHNIPDDRGSKRLHQEGASATPSRAFNAQDEPEDEASD
ncbi:hypothetical protein BJ138DRAFT_1139959 [Hygrophoropsis aurantiaca]|uniref:Uncharacterized protein n=1 Tax=Hygrophoropsis aurantiaca TaxID=72124 RepID=A0ACB8AST6_9AGAM|nr:hypothetical protein BJ138DRAFT_1139959 [Hygrophoropsis aurantiaca]